MVVILNGDSKVDGDVHDKSVPSADAISLFDNFLVCLSVRNLMVFVISGNHGFPNTALKTLSDKRGA